MFTSALPRHARRIAVAVALGVFTALSTIAAAAAGFHVGVGRIDITPEHPIRLSGYGSRRAESDGVAQRIWAKALAIGETPAEASLLVTVDNCGVPAHVREEVAARLSRKAKIRNERIAICSSHTHTGPCLSGILPNLFSSDIAAEQQATIDRYTRELTDKIEKVCLAALADRKPSLLAWGEGKATFARNRRTQGGPVDHAMPLLRVTGADGKLRALLVNYACHCTTLGGDFNQVHGDWAGFAQEYIERDHPGAVALVAIGCGADSNPFPRGKMENVQSHGEELAREVQRLLATPLTALSGKLECRTKRIELPFQPHFTREQWNARAQQPGIVGYHARRYLKRLDAGEKLPSALLYLVQAWNFGDQLAMVFLPGEVVVDYSLRAKREFDPARLWMNAYSNDDPCYIPSRRILQEGGYEAEDSLWYYDRPQKLAPETEDLIHTAIHELLPKTFKLDQNKAEFPPPKSPEEAMASIQAKPGLVVELVASEPLVESPVAIDWGPDGKLWVVEMRDFPLGMDGKFKPGGRVKFLEDTNGDGKFDKATIFLEPVPFPTGITAWGDGVLVSAAPDILYAEDRDGDGKAEIVKTLFTGFATENYQARVNSLHIGLDNWIYGANGLIGGRIRPVERLHGEPFPRDHPGINISGRDFRMNPSSGAFETASGLTQHGRVRDDWDNWFGCENSLLLWHFPLPDHYVRRNPHVAPPDPRVNVCAGGDADPNRLYPISRTLQRFNDPGQANRVTSACGLGIYRDTLLADEFYGNAFVCEPVHNLVRRLVVESKGVTFVARRAADEQQREFLASKDSWFRPVQARTGPDGALWIVDMYRFVVEHPRWITPERLKELDLRAGVDKGRIYRVYPKDTKLRPVRDLTKLSAAQLVAAFDTPNGTERDRVHLASLLKIDQQTPKQLLEIFGKSTSPAARLHALSRYESTVKLMPADDLLAALKDADARIRRHAIRLTENFPPSVAGRERLDEALLALADDPDASVRFQLALSAGNFASDCGAGILERLAARSVGDAWMRAAVLSSSSRSADRVLKSVLRDAPDSAVRTDLIAKLVSTAAASDDASTRANALQLLVPDNRARVEAWRLEAVASLIDAVARSSASRAIPGDVTELVAPLFAAARDAVTNSESPVPVRAAAVRLLGCDPANADPDLALLDELLRRPIEPPVEKAVFESLRKMSHAPIANRLLNGWTRRPTPLRSRIVELLLGRDDTIDALLSAIESGTIVGAEVSAAQKQRLLKHARGDVQKRAAGVFGPGSNESRAAVVARFKSAAEAHGDAARGEAVFAQLCVSCHAFRGAGNPVGPNLAALTDKSPAFLSTAILDPNAAVEDRYVNYTVTTKDGRELSGIVVDETATSLTVVGANGARETVLRSDVTEVRASNLSMMPEGLEQNLTPESLADLIAYVQLAPAPFGSATAGKAGEALRTFMAGASRIDRLVSGHEALPYPSWLGRLPLFYCRQTDGRSTVSWEFKPDGAATEPIRLRFAAAMGFASEPAGSFVLRMNGKPLFEFGVVLADQIWASGDGSVTMRYRVMEFSDQDSNGILDLEIRPELIKPGETVRFEVTGSAANSQRWFGLYQLPK